MSIRFSRYLGHGVVNKAKCPAKPHEVTRSGLAYTPADMERMTANGIPIQSQELAARFYDGKPDVSFDDITSDRVKSNDVNDLWEEHQGIISRAKKVYHASKNKPKTT